MTTVAEDLPDRIFEAWARGLLPENVAKLFNCSLDEVNAILKAEKAKRPLPLEENPRDLLQDHFIRLESLIERLAVAASRSSGGAQVTALTAQLKALVHHLELSQAIGLLPGSHADLWRFRDGIQLANEMLDLLEERDLLSVELMDASADKFNARRRLGLEQDEQQSLESGEQSTDD